MCSKYPMPTSSKWPKTTNPFHARVALIVNVCPALKDKAKDSRLRSCTGTPAYADVHMGTLAWVQNETRLAGRCFRKMFKPLAGRDSDMPTDGELQCSRCKKETSLEQMTRCRTCNVNLCKPCARSIRKRASRSYLAWGSWMYFSSLRAKPICSSCLGKKQTKELVIIFGFAIFAFLGVFAFISLSGFPARP